MVGTGWALEGGGVNCMCMMRVGVLGTSTLGGVNVEYKFLSCCLFFLSILLFIFLLLSSFLYV